MKYGLVDSVTVYDQGKGNERQTVLVNVDFVIDRSILFEFMDSLRPINNGARREPIEAIIDHSAELGIEVDA